MKEDKCDSQNSGWNNWFYDIAFTEIGNIGGGFFCTRKILCSLCYRLNLK